mgnify:CR=1 FL=1
MAQIDLPYLCTTIGNLSGVPVRIFEGESMTFYYSQAYLPRDPMAVYREKIFAVRSHVGYLTTPHFHCYGIVNSGRWRRATRSCGSWRSGRTWPPTIWRILLRV